MQAENLVVDKSGQGQVVEEIGEEFPNIGVAILSQALVVETVNLCYLTGFVVSSENCDALRIPDFEGNEEGDSLNGVIPSINVVS